MVVASKYSEEWIFHCPDCGYVNRIHEPNKIYFHTRQEALNYGYNFCLYCSPLMKCYRKEKRELEEYCEQHDIELKVNYNNETLDIILPKSKWKVLYNVDDRNLVLYHKNEVLGYDPSSPFTGYHDQHIQKAKIISILKYAVKHDEYRKTHPLRRKGPPKKGSRNYQKEWQKYKHRQKYHEIGEGIHTVRVLCKELEDEKS